MPSAASRTRPAAIDEVVDRLRDDPALRSWAGRAPDLRVDSLAVRRSSHLAWLEVRSSHATRRLVVKLPRIKPGKADRTLAHLESAVVASKALATTFAGDARLGVATVVAYFPAIPAVVWEEVPGETLDAMARRVTPGLPGTARLEALERACFGAGRWLRVLQDATPAEGALSIDAMVAYVDVRLERIGELGPGGLGAEWRDEVRRTFQTTGLTPADCRLAAVHGDFTLSNVMCAGERIVAIDLTRFGTGSIYQDVTRLYHQLGLLLHKPYVLPGTVARLRAALIAGYGGLETDHPLFRLFLIQHLLTHWLGLLKMSAAPYHVRAYHRWVGYRQKRELDDLVARF